MKKNGIFLGIHYKLPVHKQQILKKYKYRLPVTENISNEIVSLPIYTGLSLQSQSKIIKLVNSFY